MMTSDNNSRKKFFDALNDDDVASSSVPDITKAFGINLPVKRGAAGGTPFKMDENGHTHVGHFVLSETGIVDVIGEITWDEWQAMFYHTEQVNRAIQWIIADLAVYAADVWGKKYDELAQITGYTVTTITDMAYVARQVEFSVRTEKLSFTHHKLVAAYDEADQRRFLADAARLNLNNEGFRYYLEHGKPPTLPGEAGRFEIFLIKNLTKYRKFPQKAKKLQPGEREQVRRLIDEQIEELQRLKDEL